MHTTAKIVLVALASACVTALVMLLVLSSSTKHPMPSDHPPPNNEDNVEVVDSEEEKMVAPDGGSALSLQYTKDVTIDLERETATLYFKNAGKSLQDAVLFLVIEDTVILQSGLLPAGNAVRSLSLPSGGTPLHPGIYEGVFCVQFYHSDGTSAQLNSRIEGITVTVQ